MEKGRGEREGGREGEREAGREGGVRAKPGNELVNLYFNRQNKTNCWVVHSNIYHNMPYHRYDLI